MKNRNFQDCYKSYQIAINEQFFTVPASKRRLKEQAFQNRHRKITKAPQKPLNVVAPKSLKSLNSLKENMPSLNQLPPVEEEEPSSNGTNLVSSIRELEPQHPSRKNSIKGPLSHSRYDLSRHFSVCTFRKFKSQRALFEQKRVKCFSMTHLPFLPPESI